MNHLRRHGHTSLILSIVLMLSSFRAIAYAGSYTFTNIADTTGAFSGFGITPTMNNAGTVAFTGFLDAGPTGIFTGNGAAITTIASDSSGFAGLGGFPSINNSGAVAFWGYVSSTGVEDVYTGSGGATTNLTTGRINAISEQPSLNDTGRVGFWGDFGIYSTSGGPITTVADGSGPFTGDFSHASINSAGTVVFRANLDAGGSGIYTGSGGPTVTIADSSGPFSGFGGRPAINDAGTVAFFAGLDSGGAAIVISSGGVFTTIADTSGGFLNFGAPALNNAGAVAFGAYLDAGGHGLFTGPDPIADKIIQTGDSLFGSTVTYVEPQYRPGFNDNGDIAFSYTLANDVHGVAVAHLVPEPATITSLALGATLLLRRRALTTLR